MWPIFDCYSNMPLFVYRIRDVILECPMKHTDLFDFISHFYQLFLVSCLFDSYLLLADDHVNNVSYFPFMSIKKVFCVLREDYYVMIWLIVRICVFIKDWKLIYSELFILKRKSMENWGRGSWHKLYGMHLPVKCMWFFCLASHRWK